MSVYSNALYSLVTLTLRIYKSTFLCLYCELNNVLEFYFFRVLKRCHFSYFCRALNECKLKIYRHMGGVESQRRLDG